MTIQRLILLLLLLVVPVLAAADEIAVIVNKNNPVTTLSQSIIKKIFLGKKTFWSDGHRIDVYLQNENQLHRAFTKSTLNKSARQFKMYWRRELYSGTGLPPQQLPDDQSVKAAISSNPSAIGYINSRNLDDNVKEIRILDDSSTRN